MYSKDERCILHAPKFGCSRVGRTYNPISSTVYTYIYAFKIVLVYRIIKISQVFSDSSISYHFLSFNRDTSRLKMFSAKYETID